MLDIIGWESGWLDWKLGWRVCGEKWKIKIKLISLSLVLPWEKKKRRRKHCRLNTRLIYSLWYCPIILGTKREVIAHLVPKLE
jgi:hypothetical protein